MSKKKPEISTEEKDLFQQAIKGTTPIKHDKHGFEKPPPKMRIKRPHATQESKASDFRYMSQMILEKLSPDDWLTAEDSIHFARTGIPHRTLSKLKRGQLGINARLDLHGLTGDEALAETQDFITACLAENACNLLIVHGKGKMLPNKGPTLKNLLNQWLRDQTHVLAFCSAKPCDGGQGAIYLLLRRRKTE